jgi:pimeloyl-ACP methyl ester carboxylesterase
VRSAGIRDSDHQGLGQGPTSKACFFVSSLNHDKKTLQTDNVYFISGLGADRRLFIKLKLPAGFKSIHLDWIAPRDNETILDYAARLARQIDTSQPFYLVGLSFGGMVASELTRLVTPVRTIIISSAPTAKEIPWYYKTAGLLRLPRLLPAGLLKKAALSVANPAAYWFFGASTKEEKGVLKEVLQDMDPDFVKWALTAITCWKTRERPGNLFHIHGTADKVLPIRFTAPDYVLKGGEHLIVFSKSEIVSEILARELGEH